MHRLLPLAMLVVPCAVGLGAGCAKKFQDMRTPSGEFCSDMPVFPAGTPPDHEYHRLKPIASDPETRTEAERLESLRKAACEAGGDAVIEAVNEEVRMPNATYATVSSGTAIIWTRRSLGDPAPLAAPTEAPENAEAAAEPEPAPAAAEPQAAAPVEEPEPPPMKPEPAPAKPSKPAATSAPAPAAVSTKSTPAPTPATKTAPPSTATAKAAPAPTSTTKAAPTPTSTGKATFLKKK